MSSGLMLEKIPMLVEAFVESDSHKDVNDALEFYNICLFIRNKLWLVSWTEEYKEKLISLERPLFVSVAKFFSTISDENFNEFLMQTDYGFRDDFLSLICELGIIKKISWSPFSTALENNQLHLNQVLSQKKLVDLYGENIRQSILSNPINAELILSNLSDSIGMGHNYHFPIGLKDSDVKCLFMEYINSPDPNLNCIQQIANYKNGPSVYKLPKEVIYAAKRRYEALVKLFFKDQQVSKIEYSVSFQKQDEHKIHAVEGSKLVCSYDSDWIKNHLGYQDILYNFDFLFEWFDRQFRITLLSHANSRSLIELIMGGRNKSDYLVTIDFDIKNEIAAQQLRGYYHMLQYFGLQLEDVFRWFYTDYLDREFGIKDFHISFTSSDASFYEKCKSIAPEFESILKQYASLCKFGKIDHPYIENVIPEIQYTNLLSLCENNYAYTKNDGIKFAMFSLFSDQSMCFYIEELGDTNEECLVDQIHKHKIKYSSLGPWQARDIDQLIELDILAISDEHIQINENNQINILRDLYDYGFICPLNYPDDIRLTLDEMIKRDLLYTSSSLLSDQEGNYFDYYLNDSVFGNSLGLRNKYSHGTPGESNETDYFIFLKLMALLTIKIDNDLQNSNKFYLEE
jgi:hypothetical protein